MRDAIVEAVAAPAQLLTTGEAAKLLNCSRQHVVNLCDDGQLAFTTVGTHRRVLRSDVEAIRTRTDRLSRSDRRSLWLAFGIAGKVVADPDQARAKADAQIAKMRETARGQAKEWLNEWARLLDGPTEQLVATLTERSLRGRELRQNSPFAGLLTKAEREQLLEAWEQHDSGNPR